MPELYFGQAMTIGTEPGKAVSIRAGEVFAVDDGVAKTLLKHPFVSIAGKAHADARRVSYAERKLEAAEAARVVPQQDKRRLAADEERDLQALRNKRLMQEERERVVGRKPAAPA